MPDLATLYQAEHARLLRLLTVWTGNRQDAEDLLQDVWLRALTHPIPPDYAPRWLVAIARHLAADRFRRRARLRWEPWPVGYDVADPAPGPEHAVLDAEALAGWRTALATLTPGDQALLRQVAGGASVAAIARTRGLSLAAAKARVWRAKQRWRAAHGIEYTS